MGLPFPSGLRLVDQSNRGLTPWAWAVNGFASVVGAVGGTTLAVSVGFTTLVLVAMALYVLAAVLVRRLGNVDAVEQPVDGQLVDGVDDAIGCQVESPIW
jgi:hypothetical protein